MNLLADSLKKTLSIAEGWEVGTLIIDIEEKEAHVLTEKGREINLKNKKIEVLDINEWTPLADDQDLFALTEEGWPLYAGLLARIKENER